MATLIPLYDKKGEFCGWFQDRLTFFDRDLRWVAYVNNDQAFSVDGDRWLGPVHHDGLCLDRDGKPVLWGPKSEVSAVHRPRQAPRTGRPFRPSPPAHPNRPPRPERPTTPPGGWSPHDFHGWLGQGKPAEPVEKDASSLAEKSAGSEAFDLFEDL